MDEEDEEVAADAPTAPVTPMMETPTPDVLPTSTVPIPTEPSAQAATLVNIAQLPSNAIELSNTAPVHTEAGLGDLGVSDAGMEVHHPEPGGDVIMGDDETVRGIEKQDEGLVMGEMEPPIPEMGVVGGDEGPYEMEQ